MHNTILIDDCDPSVPAGPFRWHARADARVLVARTGRELDFAAGAMCGRAATHVRAVLTLHGVGWLIVDRVAASAPATADVWWHLHPMWEARESAGGVSIDSTDGVRLGLAVSQGEVRITRDPDIAAVSFEYGVREIGTAIRVQHRGNGPFAIACFIPEAPLASGRLRVRQIESRSRAVPGWAPVAFAITCGVTRDLAVELQFPDGREAEPDEQWPQPCIHTGRAKEMAACAE
jgi:hypothetical protein